MKLNRYTFEISLPFASIDGHHISMIDSTEEQAFERALNIVRIPFAALRLVNCEPVSLLQVAVQELYDAIDLVRFDLRHRVKRARKAWHFWKVDRLMAQVKAERAQGF